MKVTTKLCEHCENFDGEEPGNVCAEYLHPRFYQDRNRNPYGYNGYKKRCTKYVEKQNIIDRTNDNYTE